MTRVTYTTIPDTTGRLIYATKGGVKPSVGDVLTHRGRPFAIVAEATVDDWLARYPEYHKYPELLFDNYFWCEERPSP